MNAPRSYVPRTGHVVCRLRDVPVGWEYRPTTDSDEWVQVTEPPAENASAILVEARRGRGPDPVWLNVDGCGNRALWWDGGHRCGVTTVSELVDREDLDRWEYADTEGYWSVVGQTGDGWFADIAGRDPAFPVTIRPRRET